MRSYLPAGTTPRLNSPFVFVVVRAAGLPPGFFPSLTSTPLRGAPVVEDGPFCAGAAAQIIATIAKTNADRTNEVDALCLNIKPSSMLVESTGVSTRVLNRRHRCVVDLAFYSLLAVGRKRYVRLSSIFSSGFAAGI